MVMGGGFLPSSPEDLELGQLRQNWMVLLIIGILLAVVGLCFIASPILGSVLTVELMGVLLMVGAGLQLVNAFMARQWGGFFLHLIAGLLYLAVGVVFIDRPFLSLATLTLFIAISLVIGGLFRIIAAATEKFAGRLWVLLNGVIATLLGVLIWRQWPESSLWVVGLFVGIDMLLAGWTWVALALALRPPTPAGASSLSAPAATDVPATPGAPPHASV